MIIVNNDEFELSFLAEVPQRLKVELSLCIYRKYIEKLPFFKNQNGHFITFVCPLLVPHILPENEIIYREGDLINGIYFLVSGKVGMILDVITKQHVFMYIEQGNYFGEIDLLSSNITGFQSKSFDKKRKFTTVTKEICELVVLHKKNLYLADNEFDFVLKEIFDGAEKRYQKAMKAMKEAREYYNSVQKASIDPIFPIQKNENEKDENIFSDRKQNYNDSDNNTIIEVAEDEDNTVGQINNKFKSPVRGKVGFLPGINKNANPYNDESMEDSKDEISPHTVKNKLANSLK